jgi:hypothetical protein
MSNPNPAPPSDNQQPEKPEVKEKKEHYALSAATSELLFVLLPFIVIAITLGHRGELGTIFFMPELSIVSSVISGQAIVKFAQTTMGRKVKKPRAVLVISALLVCLLVPVLVILSIVLSSQSISIPLAVTQTFIFILSAFVFWLATVFEAMGNAS